MFSLNLTAALLWQTAGEPMPDSLGLWAYVGKIAFIIVMFVAVAFLAYYTTRFISSSKLRTGATNNIRIIESTSVGPQSNIHLVCVAGKYVLIGVTKEKITFLTEVSGDGVVTPESAKVLLPFESYLSKFFNKKIDESEQGDDSGR